MIAVKQQEIISEDEFQVPEGIEFDKNGNPMGCFTVEEVFDELDAEFIEFYGEFGRQLINESRIEWNKNDRWNFKLF